MVLWVKKVSTAQHSESCKPINHHKSACQEHSFYCLPVPSRASVILLLHIALESVAPVSKQQYKCAVDNTTDYEPFEVMYVCFNGSFPWSAVSPHFKLECST